MTESWNDFIVYDIISSMESNWVTDYSVLVISSMESNWVTDFGSLQRLAEEITPFTYSIKEVCE